MRKIENKHLKKLAHYIYKSTQTKLVVWVLLDGTLKLLPLNPNTRMLMYKHLSFFVFCYRPALDDKLTRTNSFKTEKRCPFN